MATGALKAAFCAALACAACSEKEPGRKLASGIGRQIKVGADAVVFLLDARRARDPSVPEDLLAGDLYAARLQGGETRKVGSGVPTLDAAVAFAPGSSRVAFFASWRFREGLGELWTVAPGEEPRRLAAEASSFAWAPSGEKLAFATPGHLGISSSGGEALRVPLPSVHGIAWSPDARRIGARTVAAAGGTLFLVDAATGATTELATGTSDFAFARDGVVGVLGMAPAKGGDRPVSIAEPPKVREIGRATAFAFSPDGGTLALLSTAKDPGEATGQLRRVPRRGGATEPLGDRVGDWRWAPSGELVFLAGYDVRARAGRLTVAAPGSPPREIAPRVQSFAIEGRRVLYLVPVSMKGDFRIELWTAELPSGTPRRIDDGVYGWQLSPDGTTLYYKARCGGGPRSCALLKAPIGSGEAIVVAAGIAGFDLSRDGSRILLQHPHRGAPRAVDLAVVPADRPGGEPAKPFVEEADPGASFADSAGRRVVFATLASRKAGVYVKDAP